MRIVYLIIFIISAQSAFSGTISSNLINGSDCNKNAHFFSSLNLQDKNELIFKLLDLDNSYILQCGEYKKSITKCPIQKIKNCMLIKVLDVIKIAKSKVNLPQNSFKLFREKADMVSSLYDDQILKIKNYKENSSKFKKFINDVFKKKYGCLSCTKLEQTLCKDQ